MRTGRLCGAEGGDVLLRKTRGTGDEANKTMRDKSEPTEEAVIFGKIPGNRPEPKKSALLTSQTTLPSVL